MIVSRRHIENCLAHPSEHEILKFGGRGYVQVATSSRRDWAKKAVSEIRAKGYLVRATPAVKGDGRKVYMIMVHHAPKKEAHDVMNPMDWHSGAIDAPTTRRMRTVKHD